MPEIFKHIKLVEVYADIAGQRKGAALGLKALRKSSSKINSHYYESLLLMRLAKKRKNKMKSSLNMQSILIKFFPLSTSFHKK